ncbi:MAG: plasma-membrane proton-efflux P-type ATPase [Deltaproteobacteria bacterium]|nr:plasma-membrane proton-efflux P-type ATPase [Deltaproteobacteria bacterium]
MPVSQLSAQQAEKLTLDDLYQAVESSPAGLAPGEAAARLAQLGPNALEEHKKHPLLEFLRFFWGPIPWMIEAAAILSALVHHWDDLTVILVLLVFNGLVGFWQEHKAASALAALQNQLALTARVKRGGAWQEVPARELVPGDLVRLKLGDIVPADAKLMAGDYLTVDQSALTGESLPVNKKPGEMAFSGSVARQGSVEAVVTATGAETFFGRTASLVEGAGAPSHFQKAVLTIGDYLIFLTLGLVTVLILVGLGRGAHPLVLVQFALILTVAAIPVAMPAVLSVTMAVGALSLSKMKAIVSRLESIEEMAGMDVLCSDKTGTLTQNQLTLGDTSPLAGATAAELLFTAALASQEEGKDAIDSAILAAQDPAALAGYTQERFQPFDPVSKRTEAQVKAPDGTVSRVAKGAPQAILALCPGDDALAGQVSELVEQFAAKGYRTLGVARAPEVGPWTCLGLLSLFDPPREDAALTIRQAQEHGIVVKMVTGDHAAIARETCRQLGLGQNIESADQLFEGTGGVEHPEPKTVAIVEQADGFAQVFPEHKYGIVKALQQGGHLAAMTGDGVNDAPALKQADVGIAVSGATDAARAAADLILTAPGLGVIISAVEEARRIFERMNSYATYRITETIRIMFFVVLAMLFYNFYPITAIMIILLALLNDVPIMTIASDRTEVAPRPVRWDMRRVLTVATVLGTLGVAETFLLLIIARSWLHLSAAEVQSLIFLKLAVAGHLTLFVARTRGFFLRPPYPSPAMIWSALATKLLATLVVGLGWFVAPLAWDMVGLVWAYCLVWVFVEDWAKIAVYQHLAHRGPRHQRFLTPLKKHLHHNL